MPINIVMIDVEEIQRKLQGHMPQHAINLICEMSIRQREMEKAINAMEAINQKLMKAVVLVAHLHPEIGSAAKQMQAMQKQFNADFNDPHSEQVLHEELKEQE